MTEIFLCVISVFVPKTNKLGNYYLYFIVKTLRFKDMSQLSKSALELPLKSEFVWI
jgi:hypothetical protein